MTYTCKYYLLPLIFCLGIAHAQQRAVDSMLIQLQRHPAADTVRLNLLSDLGWSYRPINAQKGLDFSEQAIQLAKTLNDKPKLASAYNTKAWNYSSLGRDSAALQVFQKALDIRIELKDASGIARIRYNIGIMYFNLSDYPKALEYQQSALDYFRSQNDQTRTANCYNAIGLTYQYVADYPKALDCYLRTMALYEKTGATTGAAPTLTNIGILYKDMRQFDKALQYHRKALDLYRQEGNQQGMANCLGNIGVVYDELQQPEKALDNFRQALAISHTIGFQSGIASNLTNIGAAYAGTNQSDKAIDTLQQALKIWAEIGDKNNEAEALQELAKVYAGSNYAKASGLLEHSLALAQEIRSPLRQQAAWEYLAELREKQHDYAGALAASRQATIFRDSITNTERAKEMTRKELQFDLEKQQTLNAAALNKQLLIRNSILAGVAFLTLTAIAIFILYKRRRDAESRAEVAETEMKALRAQMNPHFIFNSLNSISDFISKNDTASADLYLSRFSRLMRLILENSEWTEVSLADDLKALEIYIQLESLRLNHKFHYRINVEAGIDKELTLVPPLLLQPFVENSIWHGISQKTTPGTISIEISRNGNSLVCTVEDDGPGFNQTQTNGHRSLGMKITGSRIDIINKTKGKMAALKVTSQPGHGTRVDLTLPLELRF